ncbi:MAG: hypothetical protein HQ508_06720 [Candidatus Marinimicrobia bacterium]|nr:hypothetical protein [Candidatus Neomarinimicrobiota bacterium]
MISTIVFLGDSITAAGRTQQKPLGEGYVSQLTEILNHDPLFRETKVINSGINGNTAADLLNRVEEDVVEHRPDILVIKIGINEAYNDFHSGNHLSELNRFEQYYATLLNSIKTSLPQCQIILLTPFYISDNPKDALSLRVAEYSQIVKFLGKHNNFRVLDTQIIFDKAVTQKPAGFWAEDGVHPVLEGHKLLAAEIYVRLKAWVI